MTREGGAFAQRLRECKLRTERRCDPWTNLREKVADSVYRPTNKFVPFSATLPVGNGIAINTAPKLHGYAVILMRCICTAIHPCHSTFVIRRGRASPFFVVEPKRIHVGIYPQSGGPITGGLGILITLLLLTFVSRPLFALPLFCRRLPLQSSAAQRPSSAHQ